MHTKGNLISKLIPIFFIAIFLTIAIITIKKAYFEVAPVAIQTHTAIYRENQERGTTSWKNNLAFTLPKNTWSDDQRIYGYANLTSINKGESIEFKISTKKPAYAIEIYRMGWYGGDGAKLIKTVADLKGIDQEIPLPSQETGLLTLNWNTSYILKTETDWVSGVYLAKLITNESDVGFIIFVVRSDNAPADIVFQLPVTSYSAYNNWGGKSLYDYNSKDGRAYKISFNRPYASARGAGLFFDGDYNMIRWLESKGYDVTYITSVDLERNPDIFNGRKVFLSNWHDEYWSKNMRNNLTSALTRGIDLAFFDANNIYQQIRFEKSLSGEALRTIVCYKSADLDPMSKIDPSLTTVKWREEPVNQPENALLGVMYIGDIPWGESFPWVVKNADHWIYEGTNLQNNDKIPGLVGYEYDAIFNNGYTPSGIEILSSSPVKGSTGEATANSSIYTALSNARVFSAGTIYWPWKLDDNDLVSYGADTRIQRMTANILDAMINDLHLSR